MGHNAFTYNLQHIAYNLYWLFNQQPTTENLQRLYILLNSGQHATSAGLALSMLLN